MTKNIGLFWIKDDFRINKNLALVEATKNHDCVVAFTYTKKRNLKIKRPKNGGSVNLLRNLKKN